MSQVLSTDWLKRVIPDILNTHKAFYKFKSRREYKKFQERKIQQDKGTVLNFLNRTLTYSDLILLGKL